MTPIIITARDLGDAWFQLMEQCYLHGRDYVVGEGSYAGCQTRREIPALVHITHPGTRPLLPVMPPGMETLNPVPGGIEWVENDYVPYLLTDRKMPGEEYTYGQRLTAPAEQVRWKGSSMYVDDVHLPAQGQLEACIAKLRRGPGNNQACMTVALPGDVHLANPPCLRLIDCRLHPPGSSDHGQLQLFIYFRSWDVYSGFPSNMAALVYLQEYMASEIGCQPGEISAFTKGAHLYSQYWGLASRRLNMPVDRVTDTYLDEATDRRFAEWLREVNEVVQKLTSVSVSDLEDMPLFDSFASGCTATEFVHDVVRQTVMDNYGVDIFNEGGLE